MLGTGTRKALLSISVFCLLVSGGAVAQGAGIKSYSSYEAYCADNPKAPTCINGKPITLDDVVRNGERMKAAQREQIKIIDTIRTPKTSAPSPSQTLRLPPPKPLRNPDLNKPAASGTQGAARKQAPSSTAAGDSGKFAAKPSNNTSPMGITVSGGAPANSPK